MSATAESDQVGCDFLWSAFVAAAKSYRFSSILTPFPPQYTSEDGQQTEILPMREDISRINNIKDITNQPKECQDLLKWTLKPKHFHLKQREKSESFAMIKELTGQIVDTPEPHFVFEVVPSEEKAAKFQELKHDRRSLFAYHGSRFDNFFSILHNGLNAHLNKVSAYGEGTYLSSELSLCLMYSPAGEGWRKSSLGLQLSCIAVCEMIDDPSVKCQVKEGSASQKKLRAQASKMTDAVPEKYYIAQNNDMVRVRYLLVYRAESNNNRVSQSASYLEWLRQHKFSLLMAAYVFLLIAIGIASSSKSLNSVLKFYRRIMPN